MKLKFIFIIIALVAFGHSAPSLAMQNNKKNNINKKNNFANSRKNPTNSSSPAESIAKKNLSPTTTLLTLAINNNWIIEKYALESGAKIKLNDKNNA